MIQNRDPGDEIVFTPAFGWEGCPRPDCRGVVERRASDDAGYCDECGTLFRRNLGPRPPDHPNEAA